MFYISAIQNKRQEQYTKFTDVGGQSIQFLAMPNPSVLNVRNREYSNEPFIFKYVLFKWPRIIFENILDIRTTQ